MKIEAIVFIAVFIVALASALISPVLFLQVLSALLVATSMVGLVFAVRLLKQFLSA